MTTQVDLLKHGFTSTVLANGGQGQFINSKCGIINDLIFGLCVWDGNRWCPMSELDLDDIIIVKKCIAAGGHFLWHDKLDKIIEKKQVKITTKEVVKEESKPEIDPVNYNTPGPKANDIYKNA